MFVLQRGDLSAADEGGSGAGRAVCPGDVGGPPQIGSRAREVDRGHAEAANADAAETQRIGSSVEVQNAAATADADNEASLDDVQLRDRR